MARFPIGHYRFALDKVKATGLTSKQRLDSSSLPYNGQSKNALTFYNKRIESSLSIFKAPEDTILGATPISMVSPLQRKNQHERHPQSAETSIMESDTNNWIFSSYITSKMCIVIS